MSPNPCPTPLARISLARPRGFLATVMRWLVTRSLGRSPRSWGIAAHHRGLLTATLKMEATLHRYPKIPKRLASLVSLTAAHSVGCHY